VPAFLFGLITALHRLGGLNIDDDGVGTAVLGTLFVAMAWSIPLLPTAALVLARPSSSFWRATRGVALFVLGGAAGLFGIAGIVSSIAEDEPVLLALAFGSGVPAALWAAYALARGGLPGLRAGQFARNAGGFVVVIFVLVFSFAMLSLLARKAGADVLAFALAQGPLALIALFLGTPVLGWAVRQRGKQRGEDVILCLGLYASLHRWTKLPDGEAQAVRSELHVLPRSGELLGAWRCSHCPFVAVRCTDASGDDYVLLASPREQLKTWMEWLAGPTLQRVADEPDGARRWRLTMLLRFCRWLPMSSEPRALELERLGVTGEQAVAETWRCSHCASTRTDIALSDGRMLLVFRNAPDEPEPLTIFGLYWVFARGLFPASDTMAPSWPPGTSSSPQPRALP
jgi:hypothetical protein